MNYFEKYMREMFDADDLIDNIEEDCEYFAQELFNKKCTGDCDECFLKDKESIDDALYTEEGCL